MLFYHDFQYNPLLTYTVRFKKMSVHGNITGNFTIDQYKDDQYVNGNITIHSKLLVDKVSKTIVN